MLDIQYIPYQKIESLSMKERVDMLISLARSGKILLVEGRLSSSDETLLIKETMTHINEKFSGLEIGVLHNHEKKSFFSNIRHKLAKMLVGERSGITIIGPAKIIGELRSHPENLEIYFDNEYLNSMYKKRHSKDK